jgi:hypothetical protein
MLIIDDFVALAPMQVAIARIGSLETNWDGFGSVAPTNEALSFARNLVARFYASVVATGLSWQTPLVTASEEGSVVFEWWKGGRKVSLYIGPQQAHYIQVWGSDPEHEMLDGQLDEDQFQRLWIWLSE